MILKIYIEKERSPNESCFLKVTRQTSGKFSDGGKKMRNLKRGKRKQDAVDIKSIKGYHDPLGPVESQEPDLSSCPKQPKSRTKYVGQ